MTVVPYERKPEAWVALQSPALELANQIAGTDFVPTALRNNPAAITAAILYGAEVGLGPMMSLSRIAVINGRPTLAAEAQRALILAAGHDIWVEETTTTKCTVAGRRRDSEATSRVTWTMDDAKRAGLAGKQSYRAYPRQMLLARASAELARAVFPDAIGGLAATEELEDDIGIPAAAANGAVDLEPDAPKTTRRRRANVSAPASTPPAPASAPPELPPLPGNEPGPPASEPVLMTGPQRNRLMQLFGERGFSNRQHRLAFSSAMIHRPIETSNELTEDEARSLITILENQEPTSPEPAQPELPDEA